MVFSGMKNADFHLSGVSFLYASMLESVCAVVVRICVHLLCFGVIKLIKMGNVSPIQRKIFGLGRPRGMVWGGRREEGSGWGTHVYLWRIHFDIWQN